MNYISAYVQLLLNILCSSDIAFQNSKYKFFVNNIAVYSLYIDFQSFNSRRLRN